jgi:hypothetical protein
MRLQGSGQRSAERACCAPICMRKDWVSGQAGEGGDNHGSKVRMSRVCVCASTVPIRDKIRYLYRTVCVCTHISPL